jgi:hypothetical protein
MANFRHVVNADDLSDLPMHTPRSRVLPGRKLGARIQDLADEIDALSSH